MRALSIVSATVILAAGAALAPLVAAAQNAPDPHWIRDSGDTFCRIYNAFPEPGEKVVWKGPMCRYAEAANGEGELTWFKDGQWTIKESGKMVDGKMEGEWSRKFASGVTEKAYWIDGTRMPKGFSPPKADTYASSNAPADNSASAGSGYRPAPPPNAGDSYLETLKRQNRENCARASQGANIICNPQ